MSIQFEIDKTLSPKGEQAKTIKNISQRLKKENKFQTILGATGTGKTYVMAKIIAQYQKPALVLVHNKTLAAQLYKEFKTFFPNNSVEYFVSYYDYYQPEAYVVKKDLYIEKESSINEDIDRMRLKATSSLIERQDVLIVATVSCIYGLGSPNDYKKMYITLKVGEQFPHHLLISSLIDIQYRRNDEVLTRGSFRVRGDIIDVQPSYLELCYRIELFGDIIESLSIFDAINNRVLKNKKEINILPAKHFVMPYTKIQKACTTIENELQERVNYFDKCNKFLEKERIQTRTLYDLEMLKSVGYCSGIENYSRHLSGRKKGERPYTLLDYFPDDYLIFVDESHVALPQLRGMFNGDRARKISLIDYGFRLPSALDNRPLNFEEFLNMSPRYVFVSATPGDYEIQISSHLEELINRPTGLLDPIIEIRSSEGQIDDLLFEIKKNTKYGFRTLITTLTKKMSENLCDFLKNHQIKTTYLHSDIETIERVEILKSLRLGEIDVLIGINLLREGLDLPEVALVVILDADKIGFLRSKIALIQTVGRVARNEQGRVIMYADRTSQAMRECINETNRRRTIQIKFNKKNNIVPKTIKKPVTDILKREMTQINSLSKNKFLEFTNKNINLKSKSPQKIKSIIKKLDFEMQLAADNMDFEKAIQLRDMIKELKIKKKF
jgi:excinuclease ABC subunit B